MASALSCVKAAQQVNVAAGPLTGALSQKALQTARVKTCYRIALKTAFSDYGPYHKTEFWEKMQLAEDVRFLFERNRHVTDPAKIDVMVNQVYEFIAKDGMLSNSKRYLPVMDPGGTSWQRNIPPPLEIVNQHAQTEAELLESWDRHEIMQEQWKHEDAEIGEKLFLDEISWKQQIPELVARLRAKLPESLSQLQKPMYSRLQLLEENNKLLLAVHEAIPHSHALQTELGDGPMPFVWYVRSLRQLRALVQARQQAGGANSFSVTEAADAAFQTVQVDVQQLVDGQYETPEETKQWEGVSAFQVLGSLPEFAGPELQQALKEIDLGHQVAGEVKQWLPQLSRLQLVLNAVRSPFADLDKEFRSAKPTQVRSVEELVAEAAALRQAILERGEDLYLDGKLAEIRGALQQQQALTDRLRVRDVISVEGVLLDERQQYLALHRTVQYLERVLGRVYPPENPEAPKFTSSQAATILVAYQWQLQRARTRDWAQALLDAPIYEDLRPSTARMADEAGFIAPRPIADLPETGMAVAADILRLEKVLEKFRAESVEIAAHFEDPQWLMQQEQKRVQRFQEFMELRKSSPLYVAQFGAEAPKLLAEYEADLAATLDCPEVYNDAVAPGASANDIPNGAWGILVKSPTWRFESLDELLATRAKETQILQYIQQQLPAWDAVDTSNESSFETYCELFDALKKVQEISRAEQMRALQLEYPRRERLEQLSKQVKDLAPLRPWLSG